ncbi:MAG TPA: nicotinic acid mononucleotide adenylyltransferase [Microscillaceae bacterium]|jgi:nicotinate-nucleotide adenylyltransferase|nr:nicotinic acid mononucleotide adenylyltransferase [Microscillaceae bacterium]
MKIGLFFGSFNPIHIGHLIIGNLAVETTDLEQVWYVVSPQNPFKKQNQLLHEFDRLAMVERAIADNYKLKASDVEFHLPKPSYTIDTLTYIQEKFPQHQFSLIMGSDNLAKLHKWKNYEQILAYFHLLVYPRPEATQTPFDNHPKVRIVEAPLLDISATFIRQCIRNKQSIRYLVPESVEQFIQLHKFYL